MKSAMYVIFNEELKLKCWLFEKFGLHHKIDHGTTYVSFF